MAEIRKEKGGRMGMTGKQRKPLFLLMAALFLVPAPAAPGTEPAPKTSTPDAVKKRIARERAVLLRTVEDLDKSLTSAMETMAVLEEQTDATPAFEPKKLKSDLGDLRDWYEKYAGWLGGMLAEFEADLAEHYSRPQARAWWTGRHEELTKGYRGLAGQLAGKMRELDAAQSRIEARMRKLRRAVQERRLLVEKEDLELAKELWPAYRDRPYDGREAVYKDLTDEDVDRFRRELIALGEDQKYFDVLIELERYELAWLSLKIEEGAALDAVARAIGGDSPRAIQNACRGAVRTYESDIATLRRKAEEIDGKLAGITRTGTMKMLDRIEELSRHYEKMRTRYERHIEWLRGQIGSYRADLVELAQEL